MKPRALVVDDDPEITDTIVDILTSLNHDYDTADSFTAARELAENNRYDYFLIDLQLPVHSRHGLARIQNGENLIDEMIRQDGNRRRRIIAITAHGNDRPIQSVEMMKKGIADYIPKPFDETGKTLDKAIVEMLSRLEERVVPSPQERDGAEPAAGAVVFTGGTLVFFSDHVELCGIDICSGARSQRRRMALELLRLRKGTAFVAYSGEDFAEKLGLKTGQNGASGLIRDIRSRITEALRKEARIQCLDEDVILSGGPGYRLSDRLTVQDGAGVRHMDDQGHDGESRRIDVPNRVPNVPSRVLDVPNANARNVPDEGDPDTRRDWILRQCASGHGLRAKDIEFEFGCCRKTALRDLKALVKEGRIEREGTRRNGSYRLCGAAKTSLR
jgi:DNA-binding response OmpR family regulator